MTAVRHGETPLSAAGRLTGRLDPPLTERGQRQAASLAPLLAAREWDLVIHSGARRTRDTLAIALGLAAGETPADAIIEPRLLERAYGRLEGQPSAIWTQPADVDAAPPEGESYRELGLRVLAALADVVERAAGSGRPLRVLVCTHSGVLRILRAVEEGATDAGSLLGPGPGLAEWSDLRYAGIEIPALLSSASGGRSPTGTSRTAQSFQG